MMSCPRSTFYRRLRKLRPESESKYQLMTNDYETYSSLDVEEVASNVAAKWGSNTAL